MFGKEPQESEKTELKNMMFSASSPLEQSQQQKTVLQKDNPIVEELEQPEVINIVEKISRIVSPYFIVIVGLSLYQNNFFIGTILILVGIFSLLKISSQDVARFLEWAKNFVGLS
ncbi:MAG: hypothetical protein ACRC2R_13620 [Xenococcaceae cyanobacterium]